MIDSAKRGLQGAFVWTKEAKDAFVAFMQERNWHVVLCETEADVQVARDSRPEDIIVTRDCDLLAYSTVHTIWRVIGNGRVLEYSLSSVLDVINLSRAQLVVSTNDYSKNLSRLGPENNYKIIKGLKAKEVPSLVKEYLDNERVVYVNKDRMESFSSALRVFHYQQQSRFQTTESHSEAIINNNTVDDNPVPPDSFDLTDDQQTISHVTSGGSADYNHPTQATYESLRSKTLRRKQPKNHNRYCIPPPPQISSEHHHRPAYSFRHRTQRVEHDPPPAMVQLKPKPHKEPPILKAQTIQRKKPSIRGPITSSCKDHILRQLAFEHPTVSLPIGTLQGKVNEIIGQYLEIIFNTGTKVEPSDRVFMDALCERLSGYEEEEEEDLDEDSDLGVKGDQQQQFLQMFMNFLFSGEYPGKGRSSVMIDTVNDFISRLDKLGLLDDYPISQSSSHGPKYAASSITRAVACQVKAELKRHYSYGSKTLVEMLRKKQKQEDPLLKFNPKVSAAENFMRFNRMAHNKWKICPVAPVEVEFLTFSEPELMSFLWRNDQLQNRLKDIAHPFFNNPPAKGLPLTDIQQSFPVGLVIKEFIANVDPQGLTSRQRFKKGIIAAT
ncbi:hypothetical protein FBU30_011263 [Linnemannia zychae]|nr:hypothetical protein FBU30_011263 [Linnemannia zychae]